MKRSSATKRAAASHPFIESSYQVIDGKRINTQRIACQVPGCECDAHINHRNGGAPLPANVAANQFARKGWNIKRGYCPDHFDYKKVELRLIPTTPPYADSATVIPSISEPPPAPILEASEYIPEPEPVAPEPDVEVTPPVSSSSLILDYLIEDQTSAQPRDAYSAAQIEQALAAHSVTNGAVTGLLSKFCSKGLLQAHRKPGSRERTYKVIGDLTTYRTRLSPTAGSTPGRQVHRVTRLPVILDAPELSSLPLVPETPSPMAATPAPVATPSAPVDTAQSLADELLALSARLASLQVDLSTVPEQDLIEELRRRALARAS